MVCKTTIHYYNTHTNHIILFCFVIDVMCTVFILFDPFFSLFSFCFFCNEKLILILLQLDDPAPCNETEEETRKVASRDETTDEQHPVEENPVDQVKVAVAAEEEETNPVEISAGEKEEEEEEKEEVDCKAEESVEAEIKAQEEKEETVKEEEEEEAKEKSMDEIKEIRPADERQDEKSSPVSDPLGAAIVLQGKGPLNEDVPPAAMAPVESVTSIVPGTTLRRLEDPTPFLFSRPGTLGSLNAGQPMASSTSLSDTKPKAPRYRVLEDPGMMSDPVVAAHPKIHELPKPFQHEPSYEPSHPLQSSSSAAPMMTSSSPYKGRVLEAPSSPPKSSSSSAAAAFTSSPSTDSLTSSRSLASDVLEKARTRFDRFWTKKESDK